MEPISTVVGTTIAALKIGIELADKAKDGVARKKMSEAMIGVSKLEEENADLRNEGTRLKERLSVREELQLRDDNLCWKSDGSGPFCPRCHAKEDRAIRMQQHPDWWMCPKCDRSVNKPGFTGIHDSPLPYDPV